RRARQRRAGVAEEGEHAVFLDQLLGVGFGLRHRVAVVEADELDLAAMHAARLVHPAEIGEGAVADVVAELGVGTGERRGLADENPARVDAGGLGLRAGHRGGEHRGSGDSRKSASFKFEHGDALSSWCYGWDTVCWCYRSSAVRTIGAGPMYCCSSSRVSWPRPLSRLSPRTASAGMNSQA